MTDVSLFSQAPQKYAGREFKIGHDYVLPNLSHSIILDHHPI
jgi:hypothetical protein